MPTYKTEGFVLKKKAIGEADRWYSIFTLDHGKIEAVAEGSAKISSKLAGSLEPFNLVSLMIAEGRYFQRVAGVKSLGQFTGLKRNYFDITLLWVIAEGLNSLTISHLAEPEIYKFLIKLLTQLPQEKNFEGRVNKVLQFFWFSFRFLGQRPKVDFSGVAGEIYFDQIQGTFLESPSATSQNNFLKLTKETLIFLSELDRQLLNNQEFLPSQETNRKILENFYQLVISYYQLITSRRWNSFKFLIYGK